jgi:lipoyl(octanoyl) transferase
MIHSLYLGRVLYADALRLQEELVALRTQGRIGNVMMLLEHPPVLTLGRNAKRSNVLASDELLAARGVTLHEINRGGDVTYHGPGQLIGYPIFDLRSLHSEKGGRLGPVDFVRQMEESLIRLCREFGVEAGRICGLTGVWCGLTPGPTDGSPMSEQPLQCSKGLPPAGPPPGARKIAAIGIHVARGVTSHGFAFNLTTDLRDFNLIVPCGIASCPVTSLEKEVPDPKSLPDLESLAHRAARQFGQVLDEQIEFVESLDALRAHIQAAAESAPEPENPESPAPAFPAEDTPLTVPPEIERLRRTKDRPISV